MISPGGVRSACRSRAIAPTRMREQVAERILYVRSGEAAQADRRSTSTRLPPTSIGFAPSSTTAAIGCDRQRPPQLRAALPAARSDDDARSVLHDRVPLRRHLSERSGSRWARAARSGGSRCSRKGIARTASKVAVPPRHRASCTTGTLRDYQAAASLVPARRSDQPNAPNWLQPLAASMLTTGNDRAAARFLWQQILQSDQEWLRRTAERACFSSTRWTSSIEIHAFIRRYPAPAGRAGDVGGT